MAESTSDGFSTQPRIIRNPLPGTGNILPKKRSDPILATSQPFKNPKINYTTESVDSISKSDPTTLDQAMTRPDWPHWKAAIETDMHP